MGAFLGGVLLYQTAPREGEPSYLRDLIGKYMSRVEDWDEITAVHTRALEQAAYDRNLFLNPPNQVKYVDLTFPEYVLAKPTEQLSHLFGGPTELFKRRPRP